MGNLKRMGAALLSLALISSLNLNALAAVEDTGYTDVDAGSWYAVPVYWARLNKIADGTAAETFEPSAQLTREQLAVMLYRFMEYSNDAAPSSPPCCSGRRGRWADNTVFPKTRGKGPAFLPLRRRFCLAFHAKT